jgi:hypothetical protein
MGKLRLIRGGTGRFNIVSVPFYIIFFGSIYFGWKYLPIWWNNESLKDIADNAILQGAKSDDDKMTQFIIDSAELELKLKLKLENIKISREGNRVDVYISYPVTVHHWFDIAKTYTMHAHAYRDMLD